MADSRNTTWWAEYADGRMLGFAGLMQASAAWRIKGVWVEPGARGQGIGDRLARHLIQQAEDGCAPMVEAFAWNPSYYLRLQFKRFGTLPNGAVKLRLIL